MTEPCSWQFYRSSPDLHDRFLNLEILTPPAGCCLHR